MDKQEIIIELRRVAEKLQTLQLSQRQFSQHSQMSVSTIRNNFGSWNRAIEAAGIQITPSGPPPGFDQQRISDDELLSEIIRLTRELGKKPSLREMNAIGHFSERPYKKRWGSFDKALQVAYAKYGFPQIQVTKASSSEELSRMKPALNPTQVKML